MKTTITAASHPRIFALCVLLLHDNGAVNRSEPSPTHITLPGSAVDLAFSNALLGRLTDAERETFAIGEASDAALIAMRFKLDKLHDTLNRWFLAGMERS